MKTGIAGLLLGLALASSASGQETERTGTSGEARSASAETTRAVVASPGISVDSPPADLVFWNREIVRIRATIGHETPERRIHAIRGRLEAMSERLLHEKVTGHSGVIDGVDVFMVTLGEQPVVTLVRADVDPLSGEDLQRLGEGAVRRLREALVARSNQNDLPALLRGVLQASAATALVALVIALGARARKRWMARVEERSSEKAADTGLGSEIATRLVGVVRASVVSIAWVVRLILAYFWLTFVLTRFTYTEPWGNALGSWITATLRQAVLSIAHAAPGLATVAMILFGARLAAGLVSRLMMRVESGNLALSWLPPEVARSSRRIAIVAVWLIAAALAYPFIPGSSTRAFQGLSVLIGLVVTLGSAGLINHVLAGWVILFSRGMRVGDYVRIGEHEGKVLTLGVLATRLLTPRNQELVLPNAVVTGTVSTNFSRQASPESCWVTVSVTIGYDAPWRQVEAMLKRAAAATEGVRDEPAPLVLQRALSDFYVEYDLVVEVELERRATVVSALHGAIQDQFNEYGVQILSPHFLSQPERSVVVPKERWNTPPAGSGESDPEKEKDDGGA
ncbi:MAG: mechanosensitive ion channel family protein [Thermoanaerobaculia bacterium]